MSREALFLVQPMMAVFLCSFEEVMPIRKLKKYTPTEFMAEGSHYDKSAADFAVAFIESLCHTKGTWAQKSFRSYAISFSDIATYGI